MSARLEMNQVLCLWINLKRAVTIAKIGIRQGQSWDHLTTMGTLNFGAKKGILQTKIHDFTNEFRLCRALWLYYIHLIWRDSRDRLDKMDLGE